MNRFRILNSPTRALSVLVALTFLLFGFKDKSHKLVGVISKPMSSFTTDKLGNVYTLNRHEIHKYSSSGELELVFSDKTYGDITSIDCNNPMDILVYYAEISAISFLDNTLSLNGRIELSDLGLDQTTLCCSSHENAFWVYDSESFRIKRISRDLQVINESNNLNQLLDRGLNPNFLIQRNDKVYLCDPSIGIMVFDIFGTYAKTITFKGLKQIQVFDHKIYTFKQGCLYKYDLKLLEEEKTCFTDSTLVDVRTEKDLNYHLVGDTIKIFSISN